MATNLVTCTLLPTSNLASDNVVNAWSFNTSTAKNLVEAGQIQTALDNFYSALSAYRSSKLTGQMIIRMYDRADASPRVPWFVVQVAIGTDVSTLPLEVALVLSFKAANVSGQPAARRRGRVYIGPLSAGASSTDGVPVTGLVTALGLQAQNLRVASDSASWSWVVWSQADQAAREVFEGWIDNDFDTQRRRGRVATARTLWGGP